MKNFKYELSRCGDCIFFQHEYKKTRERALKKLNLKLKKLEHEREMSKQRKPLFDLNKEESFRGYSILIEEVNQQIIELQKTKLGEHSDIINFKEWEYLSGKLTNPLFCRTCEYYKNYRSPNYERKTLLNLTHHLKELQFYAYMPKTNLFKIFPYEGEEYLKFLAEIEKVKEEIKAIKSKSRKKQIDDTS